MDLEMPPLGRVAEQRVEACQEAPGARAYHLANPVNCLVHSESHGESDRTASGKASLQGPPLRLKG